MTATAEFQQKISHEHLELVNERHMGINMGRALVFSRTLQKHLKYLKKALQLL